MLKALILLTSDVDHLQLVIDDLHRQDAEAEITVCSQTDIARGIEGIEGVARIITTRRVGDVSFSLSSSFVRQLRAERYELCVILQQSASARVGLRAIALAYLIRCAKRKVHLKGVCFVPISKVALSSCKLSYLVRRPVVVLDMTSAFLIRRAADLIVWLLLLKDRLRASGSRKHT